MATVLASANNSYITASSGFELAAQVIKTHCQAQREKIHSYAVMLAEVKTVQWHPYSHLLSHAQQGIKQPALESIIYIYM